MTTRKRRNPTPGFRMPPPYQPISGEHAPLMVPGVHPHCAMMQVAAEDTHVNYVLCRGFDTRIQKFIDYAEGNADKPGIPVAKPYGNRVQGCYQIGEIYPAVLPLQTPNPSPAAVLWRVGQNPGVAADSSGHPADLDEEVEILYDTDSKVINWLLLDEGGKSATPIGFRMEGIRESAGETYHVEPGNFTSYGVDEITGGSEERAGVTVLEADTYGDPFVQLDFPGTYVICVNTDFGGNGITELTFTEFPVTLNENNFRRIYTYLTLYYRNVGDEDWIYCDSLHLDVFFFMEGYDTSATLVIVWDFVGNDDGQTELNLQWAAYYDGGASAGKIQVARMRVALQRF